MLKTANKLKIYQILSHQNIHVMLKMPPAVFKTSTDYISAPLTYICDVISVAIPK
jgi:hypothetical protein